jgi:hypothetical protein
VGGGEEEVICTGLLELAHELAQVKGIDSLLERQGWTMPGDSLSRPMNPYPEATPGQPVSIGPLITLR